MLHPGTRNQKTSAIRRWKAGSTTLRWGRDLSAEERSFDEDLALFEDQVRDEVESRTRPRIGAAHRFVGVGSSPKGRE